jgi:hypothetical protein
MVARRENRVQQNEERVRIGVIARCNDIYSDIQKQPPPHLLSLPYIPLQRWRERERDRERNRETESEHNWRMI